MVSWREGKGNINDVCKRKRKKNKEEMRGIKSRRESVSSPSRPFHLFPKNNNRSDFFFLFSLLWSTSFRLLLILFQDSFADSNISTTFRSSSTFFPYISISFLLVHFSSFSSDVYIFFPFHFRMKNSTHIRKRFFFIFVHFFRFSFSFSFTFPFSV